MRLPKEFRLPGTEVRVRKVGTGVMLEPMGHTPDELSAIAAELERLNDEPFMPDGRPRLPMPSMDHIDFDE